MNSKKTSALLMVSGGSDSMAMLRLCAMRAAGRTPAGPHGTRLMQMVDAALEGAALDLACLHVNHQLRGEQSDGDEEFVVAACRQLGIPCVVHRVDIASLCEQRSEGMEAVAREQRYLAADRVLDARCADMSVNPEDGIILTAHTLDDRVETFLMRVLVGTGPGGLASIPRSRGRIRRPLLDGLREELRAFLREEHPGVDDGALWREDFTNEDGSNFRSRVRTQLVPVMRQMGPGFERNLARTMDLIAEEDAARLSAAQSLVYRNLVWNGEEASLPARVLRECDAALARRVLRQCLLVVNPSARLESRQIRRVLDLVVEGSRFATEVDGGVRVSSDGETLLIRRV